MILEPAGTRLLEAQRDAPLELCVVSPGSPATCLPALSDGLTGETWRLLDMRVRAFYALDLAALERSEAARALLEIGGMEGAA